MSLSNVDQQFWEAVFTAALQSIISRGDVESSAAVEKAAHLADLALEARADRHPDMPSSVKPLRV